MLGRPLLRRLSERPSCKSALSLSRARHSSACLFHVSANGVIIAAATANHRRLSQQNPYKTRVSLFELGRISSHFIEHLEKKPNKSHHKMFHRYRCCAVPYRYQPTLWTLRSCARLPHVFCQTALVMQRLEIPRFNTPSAIVRIARLISLLNVPIVRLR